MEADLWKYALRITNITSPKVCLENKKKSKLAKHVYEEGHKICRKDVKILQIEPNTTYRKHKESVHMSLVDHPISQPSLDISPIWTPVIAAEVRKLQLRPVYIIRENCFIYVANIQRICILS
jgi:hypothetical protein